MWLWTTKSQISKSIGIPIGPKLLSAKMQHCASKYFTGGYGIKVHSHLNWEEQPLRWHYVYCCKTSRITNMYSYDSFVTATHVEFANAFATADVYVCLCETCFQLTRVMSLMCAKRKESNTLERDHVGEKQCVARRSRHLMKVSCFHWRTCFLVRHLHL